MKLLHLSDLHLGKRVNEFSMLDDQRYILNQILSSVDSEKPDAIVIAGDIYDRPVPPTEAVQLFDDFLTALTAKGTEVFIISGNHDSPERISFGRRLMDRSGIHISPVYSGKTEAVTLKDGFGEVNIYLLPFIKPLTVRHLFPDREIDSYTDAVRAAVEEMKPDISVRNILVTHQFVTGAVRSESEEVSVGGTDNVDVSVLDCFDYVALGHIHGPQSIGRPTVRYCGTPLKYSFSEASHQKSITVVELAGKGDIEIRTLPLVPKRDLREIRGSYMEITDKRRYEGENTDDYVHITLTDEEDIPDVIGKLRTVYPNLLRLDYDNRRTRAIGVTEGVPETENKSPVELFAEFFELQNGVGLSESQLDIITALCEDIWEGEE